MAHAQHQAEAGQQRVSSEPFLTVGMSFRDHLITDDIEHGATGKSQSKRKHSGGNAHREESQQCAGYFHQAGKQGNNKGPFPAHAGSQHGTDDDHALRNVLQCDACRNGDGFACVSCAEADAGSNAFRQIVNTDCHDKQQHLVQLFISLGVCFLIHTGQPVQMGHQFIQQIQA